MKIILYGNHTINHKSMPSLSDEELKKEVMGLHQSVYEKYNLFLEEKR